MVLESKAAESEIFQLALRKMSSVLGDERARQIMERILTDQNATLVTADDLFRFASHLSKMGGFEGAVGAMLSVTAVLRGASGRST